MRTALALLAFLTAPALATEKAPSYDLKPGQEIAFLASVADGKVVLGNPRLGKLGSLVLQDGEIVVGLAPKVQPFYAELRTRAKTAAAIEFVATGYVGGTKIDEIVVNACPGGSAARRISNSAWLVSLKTFEPAKAEACQ